MTGDEVQFDLEIVGGPFDGAPDLVFVAGEVEVPAVIRLGVCHGDRRCRMVRCRDSHVAYWIPELEDAPPASVEYQLEDGSVVTSGAIGRARYVMGGVPPFGSVEVEECVPAGAVALVGWIKRGG